MAPIILFSKVIKLKIVFRKCPNPSHYIHGSLTVYFNVKFLWQVVLEVTCQRSISLQSIITSCKVLCMFYHCKNLIYFSWNSGVDGFNRQKKMILYYVIWPQAWKNLTINCSNTLNSIETYLNTSYSQKLELLLWNKSNFFLRYLCAL